MNDSHFTDIESAVKRLLDGDEDARKELIDISYERLKRLARKMLKDFPTVSRWEDTDDVFQRAAMRLWKSLETVKPESSRHYFNLAAMQVRRELIELARSLKGPLGLAHNLDSIESDDSGTKEPIQLDAGSDTHEATRLAAWNEFHEKVAELDQEEREVFVLVWYQGLSQQDIAKLLDVSQKTVSRRWQKASRTICELLGRNFPK